MRRFHAACSSSRRGWLTSASRSRVCGAPSWRKAAFAQQPAIGLVAEGMDALVGRSEQIFEAEFAGGSSKAAGMRYAEQLHSGIVDELQYVIAVKGEDGRVHDLENARQQGGGFERTHALLLQQVGERVDFGGEFAERVRRGGAAGAKRVVALAQG